MGVDAVDVDNATAIGTAADSIERYADVGVTENLLSTVSPPERMAAQYEQIAKRVLTHLARKGQSAWSERFRGKRPLRQLVPERPVLAHDASSRRRSRHCSVKTPVMMRRRPPRPVISSSFSTA